MCWQLDDWLDLENKTHQFDIIGLIVFNVFDILINGLLNSFINKNAYFSEVIIMLIDYIALWNSSCLVYNSDPYCYIQFSFSFSLIESIE